MVVARGCGRGQGELLFNGGRVWEDEKIRRWMVVMVAQHVSSLSAPELYT